MHMVMWSGTELCRAAIWQSTTCVGVKEHGAQWRFCSQYPQLFSCCHH